MVQPQPYPPRTGIRPGIGVDGKGGPVVDPTKNVLDLVEAAVRRIDDLRDNDAHWSEQVTIAERRRVDEQLKLQADFSTAMRAAESRRVDEQARLHSEFQGRLFESERDRINAIRAVDVGAVAVAAERSAQQATVLAGQVATSAETLRVLVASTAATAATTAAQIAAQFTDRLTATEKTLTDRIGALEKAQYESKGKSGVSDPLMEELQRQMRAIAAGQQTSQGKSEGLSTAGAVAIGAAGLIASMIAIGGFVFATRSNGPQQPQVVVTAPASTAVK